MSATSTTPDETAVAPTTATVDAAGIPEPHWPGPGESGPVGLDPVVLNTVEVRKLLRTVTMHRPDPGDAPWSGRASPSVSAAALSVAYQVQVELATGRLVGVEALARIRDHRRHAVSPSVFIPVAEHTGMIAALGRRVLATACADLAGWHARHPEYRQLGVSVNLSARQADLTDVVAEVEHVLAETGLDPAALTLEFTETVLLQPGHAMIDVLHALRALGVQIALDDFGTGYSGLSHLALLPITSVKIDRCFTASLPHDPSCVAIVRAVLGLAADLGITCVVEGIETDAQHRALLTGGPAAVASETARPPTGVGAPGGRNGPGVIGQGYLLGRPVPARSIEDRLATHHLEPIGAGPCSTP